MFLCCSCPSVLLLQQLLLLPADARAATHVDATAAPQVRAGTTAALVWRCLMVPLPSLYI